MMLIAYIVEIDLNNSDENKGKTKYVRLCPESKILDVTFSAVYMENFTPCTYKHVNNLICDQTDKIITIVTMKS